MNLNLHQFDFLLFIMSITALAVFVILFFIEAGYGKMISKKWGPAINNKVAWIMMECPSVLVMIWLWLKSDRVCDIVPVVFLIIFQIHYIQRTFIFPFLLKGKSKMPLTIMFMGFFFNMLNGFIQGYWIFYLSPENLYTPEWLTSWQFILGTCIFFIGYFINLNSDHIIRNLRAPGDTNHYLPKKGMYKYVTSANYFGELLEWTGFAILTWSTAGAVFLWWTFANLVPRANSIYKRYKVEFADEFSKLNLKRVFPFIY